jgi:hypothetical protein
VGLLAVGSGVDVGAAREHQAVEELQRLLGIHGEALVGREHHDQPPRALHGLDIAERQQRRLLIPYAPPGALERGAYADRRPFHPPTP